MPIRIHSIQIPTSKQILSFFLSFLACYSQEVSNCCHAWPVKMIPDKDCSHPKSHKQHYDSQVTNAYGTFDTSFDLCPSAKNDNSKMSTSIAYFKNIKLIRSTSEDIISQQAQHRSNFQCVNPALAQNVNAYYCNTYHS